ncbi:MAG: MoxR family ATPase [Candidatus Competibacteraceae bacterium]|nr:MoxR family ATPase [Candidatus Competibacteraceae bacterium]
MSIQRFYTGRGQRTPGKLRELPAVNPEALRAPEDYLAPPDLAAAVDVALTLGMPLLLTGEPGSGKSALADSVAYELGLGRALRFVVKSDTEARDLFYRFDTVGRFHASQTRGADADPTRYIAFAALGKAILHAKPRTYAQEVLGLPPQAVDHPGEPTRSVVLIDEIDKAPRDVPNDILVEIETMRFDIPELSGGGGNVRVGLDDARNENQYRPIVIFTSNREKALPEPFLRRCVFHHLNFPPFEAPHDGEAVTVSSIVAARLGSRYTRDRSGAAGRHLERALDFFRFLRDEARGLGRRPTLAELLDWLDYLMPQSVPPEQWEVLAALEPEADDQARRYLIISIEALLLKKPVESREGRGRAGELLAEWHRSQGPGPARF